MGGLKLWWNWSVELGILVEIILGVVEETNASKAFGVINDL